MFFWKGSCEMGPARATLEYVLVLLLLVGAALGWEEVREKRNSGPGGQHSQRPTFNFKTRKAFLDFILASDSFKNNVPPNYDMDVPTAVDCRIHVENFDTISEADMDFTVTLLLHMSWYDHRLQVYNIENMNDGYVEIDSKALDRFWVPDLYFPNEKNAYYHNVLMPNKVLRVYKSNEVTFSTRLSLTLSCKMDFRRYPFDLQKCRIETESFSYNDGDIVLRWPKTDSNVTDTNRAFHLDSWDLPQFKIMNVIPLEDTHKRRGQGNHSTITLEFTFSRNIGYYLVQMYIPSALVVMLSWISFWLNVNAVPGRISLYNMCNHSTITLEFTFSRNIGYYLVQMYIPSALVVMLSWISFWLNVNAVPGRISLGVLTVLTMTTQSSAVNASLPHVSYTKAIDIWMSTCLIFVFLALIEFAVANVLVRKDNTSGFHLRKLIHIPFMKKKKEKIIDDYSRERDTEVGEGSRAAQKKKKMSAGVRYAMYCDVGSRLLFPLVFVIFNIGYWTYYMREIELLD